MKLFQLSSLQQVQDDVQDVNALITRTLSITSRSVKYVNYTTAQFACLTISTLMRDSWASRIGRVK